MRNGGAEVHATYMHLVRAARTRVFLHLSLLLPAGVLMLSAVGRLTASANDEAIYALRAQLARGAFQCVDDLLDNLLGVPVIP
jgi:hypothetical protein